MLDLSLLMKTLNDKKKKKKKKIVVSSELNRGHFLFNKVIYQKKFTFMYDKNISDFFASTSFGTHTRRALCFSSSNSDHTDCQSGFN